MTCVRYACPCFVDADCCLQSDGMTVFRAWGALETRLSPMFFGVTMGATAGILAVVSLGGLFPLALKLAPSQNWVFLT